MLAIRLAKVGKKNAPSYRIVVANKRSGRDGGGVEIIGFYNPFQKEKLKVDKGKFAKWVKLGAKPSSAVNEILDGSYAFKKYSGSKTQAGS